jgi:double-stranded uracil-DNA glycosylase
MPIPAKTIGKKAQGAKGQVAAAQVAAAIVEEPATLPDLVRNNLDVIFVGINPSTYSVVQGHYFARKTNRFWPAFSQSVLSLSVRTALGIDRLEPHHDTLLQDHGFGFTDAVKRASPRATDISPKEFADGVADLLEKFKELQPKIACFHGIMAYRAVHRLLTGSKDDPLLGVQPDLLNIGRTRLFLAPNPSPANAHFTPADQVAWYDRLAEVLAGSD